MTTWTRDLLWRTVNERGAVRLVKAFNGIDAGTRGTLLRFGIKYATVIFDDSMFSTEVALWMIERAPFEPKVIWSARGGAA